MKRVKAFITMALFTGLILGAYDSSFFATLTAQAQDATKMPDVVKLAKDNKLGPVTFSHTNHTTKNYNLEGNGPVACIECHHTAQPAAEAAKNPPLKTAWPADRTTTLTADLFQKDPKAAGVASCNNCHVKTGETPKLVPAIPQIQPEGASAPLTLNNQMAFHRNCAGCHDKVLKARPDAKAPGMQKCAACHKK
ncbi:MAG: cytochrome c3 family protein [Acidobacteriota bacterium]